MGKYQKFGILLDQGIRMLAAARGIKDGAMYRDLADRLGFSANTLYGWKRGERLPEPEVIAQLAHWFGESGKMDKTWLEQFLKAGGYPLTELTYLLPKPLIVESDQSQISSKGDVQKESPEIFLSAQSHLPKTTVLQPKLLADNFIQEFRLKRIFTPAQQLPLAVSWADQMANFDFLGLNWSVLFGFSLALVKADSLSQTRIMELSQQFIEFNNRLARRPQELQLPVLAQWLTFTMAGVICFIFEDGCTEELITFIGDQKQGSPAFDKGVLSLLWIQTKATCLAWTVDLNAGRLYKHLGRRPDGSNYHARQVIKQTTELENIIQAIICPRQ